MAKALYQGIAFSPQAALTGNIGAADTIIPVSDVSAFPDAPNLATIGTDEGGETVLYTAKTDAALSGCQRGIEGAARAWNAGEVIGRNFTAKDHNDLIGAVDAANLKIGELSHQKQDKRTGVPFTLPVSGWQTDGAAEYPCFCDLAVEGAEEADRADAFISAATLAAATGCGMWSNSETLAGRIRFRAKNVPASPIIGEYWLEKGAVREV